MKEGAKERYQDGKEMVKDKASKLSDKASGNNNLFVSGMLFSCNCVVKTGKKERRKRCRKEKKR